MMLLLPYHPVYIFILSSHVILLAKYLLTEAMYYLFTSDNEKCLAYVLVLLRQMSRTSQEEMLEYKGSLITV